MTEPTIASRILWLAAGIAAAVVVPILAFGYQVGECVDSVRPGGSFCRSGPAMGTPAAIACCVVAAVFVVFAVRRATRRE